MGPRCMFVRARKTGDAPLPPLVLPKKKKSALSLPSLTSPIPRTIVTTSMSLLAAPTGAMRAIIPGWESLERNPTIGMGQFGPMEVVNGVKLTFSL